MAKNHPGRTALYRLYDADGLLLYIGIAANPDVRWGQHSVDKPWWREVADRKVEWCETRHEAQRREGEAIRTEKPLHNIALTVVPTSSKDRPDQYPEIFHQLVGHLTGYETLDQARELTEILKAIPDLQAWLKWRRQHVVRTLHERDGMSYTSMAPALGVLPERVSGIARGHSRSPRKTVDGT